MRRFSFFEKGTRGEVSYISIRYTKDNNKHLKSYDSKQEPKLIIYLDTNNLYGYALAPDKIEIKRKMLSDYQLKISDLYQISIGNVTK